MKKCYEYFDCGEMDCIRRKNNKLECWEIEDVLCKVHYFELSILQEELGSKKEACKLCLYYQDKIKNSKSKSKNKKKKQKDKKNKKKGEQNSAHL